MKTIAFIPVREGSKSIPHKNIKNFCGKPLIYWSLKMLQLANEVDEIVVATDGEAIKTTVTDFGLSKVRIYNRKSQNAQDHSTTEDVILEFLERNSYSDDTTFILVQATSPFTKSADISNGLKLYKNKNCDSVLSCARIKRFLWSDDGLPLNYDYSKRPRRQDFDGLLMENGAFYINSIRNIKKHRNRLSGKISISEMEEYTSVEIDEPDDWVIAENIMLRHNISVGKSVNNIQLFITDVDGVLTDAGMYYAESGEELKKFNTRDGKGIELLRNKGIKTAIITSENTKIVEKRGKKLKFDFVFQGISDKKVKLLDLCKELNIPLNNVAYIGDDINDLQAITQVGLSACPLNAENEIKLAVDYICKTNGGNGCVREFINEIILK